MKSVLLKYYKNLPESRKRVIRKLCAKMGWFWSKRNKWAQVEKIYERFGNEQHQYIFRSIARFCNINRPIDGYYFEFGCHEAKTMRMAYDNFNYLVDWTYVGFDSFEGLPEIAEIDKQQIWEKGKLKTTENDFIKLVLRSGVPKQKLMTVKGFYDQSLTSELKEKLLPKKAAVIYIDCDLYISTVPVLDFIKDFLQKGTIIVFDDWNCFYGDPDKGERKAFSEFREKNPKLMFEDFVQTNEAKSFIFIGEKE
jgi:O-methyltransferase